VTGLNCDKLITYTSKAKTVLLPLKAVTDLARECGPIQRFYKVRIHLVGSNNDGGHGLLILRSRGGQERQSCQRDVVLAARQTTFIITVRAQAVKKNDKIKERFEEIITGTSD